MNCSKCGKDANHPSIPYCEECWGKLAEELSNKLTPEQMDEVAKSIINECDKNEL